MLTPASQATLEPLILELEGACVPARALDLEISVAVNFKGAFNAPIVGSWRWGAGGDEIEGYNAHGKRVSFLDPVQFVPQWTASLDWAVELVPDSWFWRAGRTSLFRAWAGVYATHPDHGEPGRNEFFFRREYFQPQQTTPAMALCICALQAHRALRQEARA